MFNFVQMNCDKADEGAVQPECLTLFKILTFS